VAKENEMVPLKVAYSTKGGDSIFAIQQSDTINSHVLAANVAKSATVPVGAARVIFTVIPSGVDFYAKITTAGTVAAINTTDITNGSASEPNPSVRTVIAGQTISMISASACKIYLSYFS
jgi:hypothetical protein